MEQIIKKYSLFNRGYFFEERKINIYTNKYLLICYFMLLYHQLKGKAIQRQNRFSHSGNFQPTTNL